MIELERILAAALVTVQHARRYPDEEITEQMLDDSAQSLHSAYLWVRGATGDLTAEGR